MNIFIFLILILTRNCTACLFSSKSPEKCYGDDGCFPIGGDYFDPINRPFSLDPQSPEEINTTFHLFTRKTVTMEQYINRRDPESIRNSNFDPKKKLKFIIHGFNDGIYSGWMRNMSQKILQVDDVNIILVDWSKGALKPWYDTAVANARVVGREIGNLIILLQKDFDVKYEDVHLIGHSLGAHVAGHAGAWLNKTVLGQITGLDPAGPFYNNMKPTVRLDPTDALFVDVIHTNGKKKIYTSFGMYNATGHVDFYPDGGANSKSCKPENLINILVGGLYKAICSHSISHVLYIESIDESNPFAAYSCDSLKSYREAKCYTCERPGHDCTTMGYYSNRYDHKGLLYKKFYLTTNEEEPLCVFQWVIEIETSGQQNNTSGNLYISAEGENWNLTKRKLDKSQETILPNKTYRYLLEFERNPIKINAIEFSWKHESDIIDEILNSSDKMLSIQKMTLIPLYLFHQSLRSENTVTICNDSLKEIKSDETVKVKLDTNCLC